MFTEIQVVYLKGGVSVPHGKVKHQRILRLTLLISELLPINLILELDVLFTI